MKTFFRNVMAFAMVAMAAFAVSCNNPIEEQPEPIEKENVAVAFVGESNLFFAAGEAKTVQFGENQPVNNPTITAPEGWSAVLNGNALVITAPTQESVDAQTAVENGAVAVKFETCEKIYEGTLSVFMGSTIIYAEATSVSFKDVQVKIILKGVEEYRMYFGADGEWVASFDEWQNPNPMLPYEPEFGWTGTYKEDVFEGSIFEFAAETLRDEFLALPGTTYQLAILPIVEGKAVADYQYADVKTFSFTTDKAGDNGSVVPEFALKESGLEELYVDVTAPGAYATFYYFYTEADYEAIQGRDKAIKTDLINNGSIGMGDAFVASKTNLKQDRTYYLIAMTLDQQGNYGALKTEAFATEGYKFNNLKVTIGEVTCNNEGKLVYVPVSVEGGEVAYYMCAYITDSQWVSPYGGSLEAAVMYMITVPALNPYYGPEFFAPEGVEVLYGSNPIPNLVDGKIVLGAAGQRQKPWPGTKASIIVMAVDKDGKCSQPAYVEEYTPTDAAASIIRATDEGYEYGMPTMIYKNCFIKTFPDGSKFPFVNFEVKLAEGTDTVWVCGAGEEYLQGRTFYELIMEMTDEKMPFMKAQKFTEDGIFECDGMYITADNETRKALFVTWKDKNGKLHEVKLMFDPVADAQSDLKGLSSSQPAM